MARHSSLASVALAFVMVAAALPVSDRMAPVGAVSATSQRLAGLDNDVEKLRQAWKVPGVAIAIVQDGRVVLARGYGLRDVNAGLPVTADTRFGIGSTTKSFTVALLAMLVSQGRLDWDKPLTEYLPDFRLYDDY